LVGGRIVSGGRIVGRRQDCWQAAGSQENLFSAKIAKAWTHASIMRLLFKLKLLLITTTTTTTTTTTIAITTTIGVMAYGKILE
jgi:hypothetical protein